jgi:hypothetical protein
VIVAVGYDKLPSDDQLEALNLALATNIDKHIFLAPRLDDLVVQLCKLACRYIQGAGAISYGWKSTDRANLDAKKSPDQRRSETKG